MKNLNALATVILMIIVTINSAYSSTATANDSALEARIKELEAKVAKLSEPSSNSTFIKVPNFQNMELTGRMHIDSKWYNNRNNTDSKKDGIDIRTARLGVRGNLAKNFFYRLENDFASNHSQLRDAFIAYHTPQDIELKIGQFKVPFSLERLISSNDITFMERSVSINSSQDRTVGFQASTFGKNWQFAAAIFGEPVGNEARTDDSRYSLNSRITYNPIISNNKLIHLGLAVASISEDRNDATTTPNAMDHQDQYGAELAIMLGPLNFQGEYMLQNIKYDPSVGGSSTKIDSYYVQTTYFLTEDHREYDVKTGMFTGMKVKHPVDKEGIGALELAVRYSKSNSYNGTAVNNIIPIYKGETTESIAGINWYLTNNLRMMFNYSVNKVSKKGASPNENYNFFGIRTQINF